MLTIDVKGVRLLHDCQKTRLHVLVALWLFSAAPTAKDIARVTQLNRHTVGDNLDSLATDGYVFSQGYRWYLTSKTQQISLPGLMAQLAEECGGKTATFKAETALTTTSILTENNSLLHQASSSSAQCGGKTATLPDDPGFDAALQALHTCGIRGSKAEELAHLDWITPEYIKAHVAALPRKDLGLAIYRMACGDELPEQEESIADAWRKAAREAKNNRKPRRGYTLPKRHCDKCRESPGAREKAPKSAKRGKQ